MLFIGKEFDITFMVSLVKGPKGMNQMTALCFIALGSALITFINSPENENGEKMIGRSKFRAVLFYLFSNAVIVTGLLRLAEYVTGTPLSWAHLVSAEWVKEETMAPNTAFNFIILGASLVLLGRKNNRNILISQSSALLAGFIALLTLIGYIYSQFAFTFLDIYFPPMALNSALVFLILSAGILYIYPYEGFVCYVSNKTYFGRTVRRLIPAAVIFPIVIGWLRLYGERAGFYDNASGTTLYTWIIICAFIAIIIFTAKRHLKEDRLREQAEKRIAESELMLKAIIDNSPAAITLKDLEGRYILVNREVEKIMGTTIEALKGRSVFDLHSHEIANGINEHDKMVMEAGKAMSYEENIILNGAMHTFLSQKFPLYDINNRMYAICGISTDITERKKSEQNLHQLNGQLYESNKELESFSYSVSHDLRAPLRHIIGFGEKLKRETAGKSGDEEQRLMGKILGSANKMALLIDDLLMFSKVGRTELNMKSVDMNSLFSQVIEDQKQDETTYNITWNTGKLCNVNGDLMQLGLVVSNLISNAVKYTEKKNKRTIDIGSYPENGETVFYVKDNGAGFDMRYADKLFGVFQRLHKDNEYSGTGIGLATVRRIINRHGGRTWAEGELDKGASFYFTLPN
jgi:PAS domain S-box-containing protein